MKTFDEQPNMEERIIQAAKAVFIEKGYAETSMSDIAVKAGMHRPALHYYFRTKEKMFHAVSKEIISSIIPKIFDIVIQKDKSVEYRVEKVADAYYSILTRNPRLPMFIIREMNRDASFLINTAAEFSLPEKLEKVKSSIEEEMDRGKIKKVPLRFLFYTFYGLLITPFLTIDLSKILLLDDGETFEEMLDKWKPCIVSQICGLLAVK